MTADELRGRVYHYVSTMLNRPDQVRCAEGVVDNQGDIVLVSHLSQCVNIRHVTVRVAEGLGIDGFCVGADGSLYGGKVVHVDDGVGNTLIG